MLKLCEVKHAFPLEPILSTRPPELIGVLGDVTEMADMELGADCIEVEESDLVGYDPAWEDVIIDMPSFGLPLGERRGSSGDVEQYEADPEEEDWESDSVTGSA